MKQFEEKIKNPITEEEFQDKREQERVKECEMLVDKMDNVIKNHKSVKQATLASHREFTLSTRIVRLDLSKPKGQRAEKEKEF